MSSAPRISILLRPIRSAAVVIQSEMTVSPSKVIVSRKPICSSLNPTAFRYKHEHDRQEAVGEHPNAAGGEQQQAIARENMVIAASVIFLH